LFWSFFHRNQDVSKNAWRIVENGDCRPNVVLFINNEMTGFDESLFSFADFIKIQELTRIDLQQFPNDPIFRVLISNDEELTDFQRSGLLQDSFGYWTTAD
jgi:hypothetical protein